MKHRGLTLVVLSAAVLVLLACRLPDIGSIGAGRIVRGSGDVVDRQRNVRGFAAVSLDTIGTLHITVGNETSLTITADDNLLDVIETDLRGGTLVIHTQPGVNLRPTVPVVYNLTVTQLDEVVLTSSGDVDLGDLDADRFVVRISSSGDFTMGDLTCRELTVRISSSGDATFDSASGDELDVELSSSGHLTIGGGAFERQSVTLSSSGDLDAREVRTNVAELRLSSSGSATVWVHEQLTAHLSSSGSVRYAGDPALTWNSTSSGSVRPLND
jgi:hypothetical protein